MTVLGSLAEHPLLSKIGAKAASPVSGSGHACGNGRKWVDSGLEGPSRLNRATDPFDTLRKLGCPVTS